MADHSIVRWPEREGERSSALAELADRHTVSDLYIPRAGHQCPIDNMSPPSIEASRRRGGEGREEEWDAVHCARTGPWAILCDRQ